MAEEENPNTLLAGACRFLADGGDMQEAAMLTVCDLDTTYAGHHVVTVILYCPRQVFDILDQASDGPDPWEFDPLWGAKLLAREKVGRAIRAVIPPPYTLNRIDVRARVFPPEEGWREALVEEIRSAVAAAPRDLPPAE
jgi:hypothetical protein